MNLYPAIDLHHGKCVRLYQGDYEQQTQYSEDPVAVAQSFAEQGAKYLHVVDLTAAKNPGQSQLDIIQNITTQTDLIIQSGGGVRSREDVIARLEAGIERVVVGSQAVKAITEVKTWLKEFGTEKIVLALDVKQQDNQWLVATHGWQVASAMTLDQVLNEYLACEIKHVLCTDIARDGVLQGSNVALYRDLVARYPVIQWQASGGVSELGDLNILKDTGVAGVIVGKAIYEKRFTVEEAILHLESS